MTVQLDFWQVVLLLLAFFAFAGAAGKLLLDRFDMQLGEKFSAQEKAREEGAKMLRELLQGTTGKVEKLERDFLEWRAELPIHYVRREDYVRGQTVIEAKLDALYNKLEVAQLKGVGHG
jgi:hypothetical protein